MAAKKERPAPERQAPAKAPKTRTKARSTEPQASPFEPRARAQVSADEVRKLIAEAQPLAIPAGRRIAPGRHLAPSCVYRSEP
jgi:hypothetical protein